MKACRATSGGTERVRRCSLEPNFLLSNRSYWYPQNPIADYATATLRITVPEGFACVASGLPRGGAEVTLRDLLTLTDGKAYRLHGDAIRCATSRWWSAGSCASPIRRSISGDNDGCATRRSSSRSPWKPTRGSRDAAAR